MNPGEVRPRVVGRFQVPREVSAGVGVFCLVVAGIAWLTRASTVAEGHGAEFVCFLGSFVLYVGMKFIQAGRSPGLNQTRIALSIAAVVLLGASILLGVWWLFPGSRVFVENFGFRDVDLVLDGRPWMICKTNTSFLATIARRPHVVTVVDRRTGRELDRQEIRPSDSGPYVFNVLRAQAYYSGSIQYGPFAFPVGRAENSGPPEVLIQSSWFRARVDFLFVHPPASIQLKTRRDSSWFRQESRSYLLRYSHRDHPLMSPQNEAVMKMIEGVIQDRARGIRSQPEAGTNPGTGGASSDRAP